MTIVRVLRTMTTLPALLASLAAARASSQPCEAIVERQAGLLSQRESQLRERRRTLTDSLRGRNPDSSPEARAETRSIDREAEALREQRQSFLRALARCNERVAQQRAAMPVEPAATVGWSLDLADPDSLPAKVNVRRLASGHWGWQVTGPLSTAAGIAASEMEAKRSALIDALQIFASVHQDRLRAELTAIERAAEVVRLSEGGPMTGPITGEAQAEAVQSRAP